MVDYFECIYILLCLHLWTSAAKRVSGQEEKPVSGPEPTLLSREASRCRTPRVAANYPPATKSSDTCSGAEAPPTFALSAATISQPAPDPAGVLLRLPGWPPAPAEQ